MMQSNVAKATDKARLPSYASESTVDDTPRGGGGGFRSLENKGASTVVITGTEAENSTVASPWQIGPAIESNQPQPIYPTVGAAGPRPPTVTAEPPMQSQPAEYIEAKAMSSALSTIEERHASQTSIQQPVESIRTSRYSVASATHATLGTCAYGQVLSERIVEREVKVPRRRIVEESINRLIVVPETVRREEVVHETRKIQDRVIEVARPVQREKIVEVPEYEYVERVVEVPQTVVRERIIHVPKVELREQITYVPKLHLREKVVHVPQVEYRDVPYEKIVEVPEIVEEVVFKEIAVPRYVDVPVPEYRDIEVIEEVERKIPKPVECVEVQNFEIPQLEPKYTRVPVPIYAPRFIEVAVPVEQMDLDTQITADELALQVSAACSSATPSLCELENLASAARNFSPALETDPEVIERNWALAALATPGHTSASRTRPDEDCYREDAILLD